jgi:hypothetical protein
MARNNLPITSWALDESRALIGSIVAVNRRVQVADIGILCEVAEISRAMK